MMTPDQFVELAKQRANPVWKTHSQAFPDILNSSWREQVKLRIPADFVKFEFHPVGLVYAFEARRTWE